MPERLHDWFAASVRRWPDAVALRIADTSWTYRELDRASDRFARAIRGGSGRIGLLATRTPGTYIGYLAALKAGLTVVPLNPAFPQRRNRAVIEEAGLSTVIGPGPALVPVGPGGGDGAEDVAYILFTSGSTGTPKGIPIRHANTAAYLAHCIDRYEVGPGSRLSQTFDLTFDPSVFDLFVAWGGGATLVVPTRAELADPVAFVTWAGLTHWFSVPSVASLARRMRRLRPGTMPGLRWSLFAGEQLTVEQARAWQAAAPASTVENLYGPTELTVTCTAYRLPADPRDWPATENDTVPIGRCYPHLEAIVLDPDGVPAADGELCVRGPQRFRGYLDPAANAGRFLSFDGAAVPYDGSGGLTAEHWYRTGDRVRAGADGTLVHLGRLDAQVQVHGYRVELGDVEANLRRHPNLEDVAVVSRDGELSAVYTGVRTSGEELAGWLLGRLPSYMVPAHYDWLEALPLNANGKLDRARLVAAG